MTEPARREQPDDYIVGTKYEMPLFYHERGVGIHELGKVVVVYDGRKIAVLKRSVPDHIRNELFHGLQLDKIINEKDDQGVEHGE